MLKLENFRCHESKTIEFPNTGLIQLHGDSGAGKSTILTAICFALYGKFPGKIKSITPHSKGNVGSTVEFQTVTKTGKKIYMKRQTKPATFFVTIDNATYEHDEATSVVENEFGDYNSFLTSSYVVQNQNASVLCMPPSEQLKFVEQIAMSNGVNDVVKERIKTEKNRLDSIRTKLEGNIETFEQQIDDAKKNVVNVEELPSIDINCVKRDIGVLKNTISKVNEETSKIMKRMNDARSLTKIQQSTIDGIKKLQHSIEIQHVENKKNIQKLNGRVSENLRKEKFNLRKNIAYFTSVNDLRQEEQRLKEIKQQFQRELDDTRKELTSLCLNNDELESAIECLEKMPNVYNIIDEIVEMYVRFFNTKPTNKNIYTISRDIIQCIDFKIQGCASLHTSTRCNKISCLTCGSVMGVVGNTPFALSDNVHVDDSNIIVSLVEMKQKVINACRTLSSSSEAFNAPERLTCLRHALFKSREAEEKLKVVPEIFTSNEVTARYEKKIELTREGICNIRKTIPEIDTIEKEFTSLEDINQRLAFLNEEIEKVAVLESMIDEGRRSLNTFEKNLESLKTSQSSQPEIENVDALHERLIELQSQSTKTNDELQRMFQIEEEVRKIEIYNDTVQRVEDLSSMLTTKKNELNVVTSKIEALLVLEKIVKESELSALNSTIEKLNATAKIYLTELFESQIEVTIDTLKECKSGATKCQMTTNVVYKGVKYSSIDELSGGEKQRCELAFILAVNDIIGSRILLLDECLNNLDSDVNTHVLTYLRDVACTSKLILCISHEAVQGVFDSTICI